MSAPLMPGGESTSAALRRVEAELGSALSALHWKQRDLDGVRAVLAVLRVENERLHKDLTALQALQQSPPAITHIHRSEGAPRP